MILLIPLLADLSYPWASAGNVPPADIPMVSMTDTADEALAVLVLKCNPCHLKKKRRSVFSQANMIKYAPEIQEQVFVKERMPKGKNDDLNGDQRQALRDWLDELGHTSEEP